MLLCSDGLSDQVTSAEIRAAVEEHAGGPDAAVRELIAKANGAGGKDNVTVVIVEGERFTATARPEEPPIGARSLKVPTAFAIGFILAATSMWFTRTLWRPAPVEIPSRLIAVTSSIAAAMAEARAGDIVEAPPGEYREQVRLKDGVTLRARVPRDATLRAAPLSSGPARQVVQPKREILLQICCRW